MVVSDKVDWNQRSDRKYEKTIRHFWKTDRRLVTDRGTAFTSHEFTDFINKNNNKHRKVAVAAPWINGMGARVNRFIKSSPTKLLKETNNWNQHLGKLQYVINNIITLVLKRHQPNFCWVTISETTLIIPSHNSLKRLQM